MTLKTTPTHFTIPGLATAHSHAFQRALRGRTQRRSTAANSFWSWRGLMYNLVETLDPDDIYTIARLAYAELAMSGVTAIGEFHYLHHDKNGRPYANRTETAEACIQAALDVGIRICLIRTGYMRGGYQKELAPAQARFSDSDVAHILADVGSLQQKYAQNPLVTVAVAAHSIRAMQMEEITTLSDYANTHQLPFHMHVSEQRQELKESIAEHGVQPVQLLADHGLLNERFVGVHATHLSAAEITALGRNNSSIVCLCRTTERDLGDGLAQTSDMLQAGVRFCVGVDSHAEGNAFEEIRSVEMDERSRLELRHTVAEAPALLQMGTELGYVACGMGDVWQEDSVSLRRDDPTIVGIDEKHALDAILFGASPQAVDRVEVAGKLIVENGRHPDWAEISAAYQAVLSKIGI